MIKKILHQSFEVEDLEKSVKYYESLGFKPAASFEKEEGKAKAQIVELGDFAFEIWQFNDKSPEFYKIRNHIGAEVDDINETIEELIKLGSKIIIPITQGMTVEYFAFLEDLNGKIFELIVPKDKE
jgi:predicted lactoylglutathione lyase